MIKYLWDLLFYSCQHKWRVKAEIDVYTWDSDRRPTGTKYIMMCEHCGKIKVKRV